MMCLRDRPTLFGSPLPSIAARLMGERTLVTMTTACRFTPRLLKALPRISSDSP
jgi:hypothetical protein